MMNQLLRGTAAAGKRWASTNAYPTATARGSSLRQLMKERTAAGKVVRVCEAHSGLSALVVEHAEGAAGETFDATWSSSLTSSAVKGKPDIETVDTSARIGIVEEILEVRRRAKPRPPFSDGCSLLCSGGCVCPL